MAPPNNSDANTWRYGPATSVVSHMLLEIRSRNKDAEMVDIISECCDVSNGQMDFVENCTFPETALQQKIATDTTKDEKTSSVLSMLSGHIAGNFLKMMAEMSQARHILEIGTYTGYSAVTLAETAFCEELTTLDVEPYYESFLKSRLSGTPMEKKVRILIGPAEESLKKLQKEGKQFDFIFIDANKAGYPQYYQFIMDNELLSPTGTIACDNILWSATTFSKSDETGKLLHEFVDFVKNDERVNQIILPIRDGILMIKPILCCN